ncbi:Bystin, putative, partial [Hepatocystis sp. ex Piliocolobus tephrosceles]
NDLNHIVEKCYKTVGESLAIYKSNEKLPHALLLLVKSPRWLELLMLTKPQNWSAQATFEVTKLFSSNLKEKAVTKFYENILLPLIVRNVMENKRLNPI